MIRSLLIVLSSAIVLAGCASLPAAKSVPTAANCPREAAPLGSNACRPFTRTYSGRQLRQTGQTNPARALQMLDPSVTVTGGP
jgi:hypothetical protein